MDLRLSLSLSISILSDAHSTANRAILRPLHPFFEIHRTTLLSLVSYSSPLSVLFLSLSSLLFRLASPRFRAASSVFRLTPTRDGYGGFRAAPIGWSEGDTLEDADVDERVRGLGTVRREEDAYV